MQIMKTNSNGGLKVKTGLKASGPWPNHNRGGLKVKAGLKAAGPWPNHNRGGLRIKAGVRAGMTCTRNHSQTLLAVA